MVLRDKDGVTQSETKINLEIMRDYINQHFARKQDDWEIQCISEESWVAEQKMEYTPVLLKAIS